MGASFRVSATGAVISRSSLLQSVTLTAGDAAAATARLFDASGLFVTAQAGSGFSNQPSNDGIEVLSNSAADVGQVLDIYGTTTGTTTVVKESITLNGTTVVSAVKLNWGEVLGVQLDRVCAGTITIREASGDLTITTITTGNTTSGILLVQESSQRFSGYPYVYADAGTTKKVGFVGRNDSYAATSNNCAALTGATAVIFGTKMHSISMFLVGDLEAARSASVLGGFGGLPFLKAATATDDQAYFDNYALKRGLYAILTGTGAELTAVEK